MGTKKNKKVSSVQRWRNGFLLVGMSFEIAILLCFCIYLGQKGDRYFDTGAWITTILILLAFVIWFYQLIRLLK